jgi:hypothetical protein
VTFEDMNHDKGFGRGWGHPRFHKKNEKVRMARKPGRKDYKLKRICEKYTDSQLLEVSYAESISCMN